MQRVVVAGSLAQRVQAGGHAWALLQYLLGFARLGADVVFVDILNRDDAAPAAEAASLLEAVGMGRSYAFVDERGASAAGLRHAELVRRLRTADLLLNINGYLRHPRLLELPSTRVFVDIDPGYNQIWYDLGLADVLSGHDHYVTVASRLGAADCPIPTCGIDWITTVPPVVLTAWPARRYTRAAFTTVATWRAPYGVMEWRGMKLGSRVHEFRNFMNLPRLVPRHLEVALAIDSSERRDLDALEAGGWRLEDPQRVAGTPDDFRAYVASSYAELAVVQGMYVQTRSGWFSDRSACYLASGKPVIVQDTGLRDVLPTGSGLILFRTVAEAAAAVEHVVAEYDAHAAAARDIAERHLDSDRVLTDLLTRIEERS